MLSRTRLMASAAGAAVGASLISSTHCETPQQSAGARLHGWATSWATGVVQSELVTVQSKDPTVIAAQQLLARHLGGISDMVSTASSPSPLHVSLRETGERHCKVVVQLSLPEGADVAAVLGNVLGVSSFSTTISSPTAKFFGQRTMRDAMQGAQYELHSTLHRTVVHTETCEIEVLRDTASGEATLLLTAAELGAEHAKVRRSERRPRLLDLLPVGITHAQKLKCLSLRRLSPRALRWPTRGLRLQRPASRPTWGGLLTRGRYSMSCAARQRGAVGAMMSRRTARTTLRTQRCTRHEAISLRPTSRVSSARVGVRRIAT